MKTEEQGVGPSHPTILDRIIARKRVEVETLPEADAGRQAAGRRPRFRRALISPASRPTLIAEIKRRSPSAGWIREEADPAAIARGYEAAGAAAISVLTDAHDFGGSLDDLRRVRKAVDLPLIRKDFIIDPRQIDGAGEAGADAILLIVAALSDESLRRLHGHAADRGLDVLVEVHDRSELERALGVGADLIGVNSRDLRTFELRREIVAELSEHIPPGVALVAESGISTPADVEWVATATRADAILVGGSLMAAADPSVAARALVDAARPRGAV